MRAEELYFSSKEVLRLIEGYGIIGSWKWSFSDNQHIWSDGLYRILGLCHQKTKPSYDLLVKFSHPEDRDRVDMPADVIQGRSLNSQTFRIIRPDNSLRLLSTRIELCFAPDGRPEGATGVVLDVTDQEKLKLARAADKSRQRALFLQMRMLTFSNNANNNFIFTEEMPEFTGIHAAEIAADSFCPIVREEREHWREFSIEAQQAGLPYKRTPLLHTADRNRERVEFLTVCVRNESGLVADWHTLARPLGSPSCRHSGGLQEGLEQAINGSHFRAARALLDWSMLDLARSANLSISTVKRLEQSVDHTLHKSQYRAIHALRQAGVRFSMADDCIVLVGKK